MAEQEKEHLEREINLGDYFSLFPKVWWMAGLFSLAISLITLTCLFQVPNQYEATSIITPVVEEGNQNKSLALGAIASMGISFGSPTEVEDLEALFRSNDLTVRVFRKFDLWSIVLGDRYDPKTGKMIPSWRDRISGREAGPRPPVDWDAIRESKDFLSIITKKKAGTLIISVETPSAEGSANIVKHYLEEGKSRLQEEAFDRASRNKKFIEEQMAKTLDPLTRDRLYSLYGQEVEREMMARNREQFGFKIIDSPRVPDRKSGPYRALITLLTGMLAFIVSYFCIASWWKKRAAGEPTFYKIS